MNHANWLVAFSLTALAVSPASAQTAVRCDQAGHFLGAEHHRQRSGHPHRLHPGHQFLMVEGDVEEELQPADRRVERDRRDAVIDQVQLIVP